MRHFKLSTTIALVAAMAMIAAPLQAQPRGGGSSRSSSSQSSPSRGGGSGVSRSSGGGGGSSYSSRPSGGGSSYSSRPSGGSSVQRTPSGGSQGGSTYKGLTSGQSRSYQSAPSAGQSRSYQSSPSTQQRRTAPAAGQSQSADQQRRAVQSQPGTASQPRTATQSQPRTADQGQARTATQGQQRTATQGQPRTATQGLPRTADQSQPRAATQSSQPRTATQAQPRTVPQNYSGGSEPRTVRLSPNPGRNLERIHPARREPMPWDRPSRFWDRGHHYFGYRVEFIPVGYTIVHYWGRPYYLYEGRYYRYYNDVYYVCRPPFGVFFDTVLDVTAAVCHFAYFNDVYRTYSAIDDNYATIAEQNRIIAQNNSTIAQQNAEIALNSQRAAASYSVSNSLGLIQSYADAGVEYYYEDGVFFTKGESDKYVTIVPPAGALVQELPDDYEEVTMNGTVYYRVDDTIYRTTIVDGTAYFEVLGQLTEAVAKKYNITL